MPVTWCLLQSTRTAAHISSTSKLFCAAAIPTRPVKQFCQAAQCKMMAPCVASMLSAARKQQSTLSHCQAALSSSTNQCKMRAPCALPCCLQFPTATVEHTTRTSKQRCAAALSSSTVKQHCQATLPSRTVQSKTPAPCAAPCCLQSAASHGNSTAHTSTAQQRCAAGSSSTIQCTMVTPCYLQKMPVPKNSCPPCVV